jgi:predicted RNA-binding Zn ribbon-like protein
MSFAHDTEVALTGAAALVNTDRAGEDRLTTAAELDAFLLRHPYTGGHDGTAAELQSVRRLRGSLRAVWHSTDTADSVAIVNRLLRQADARPYLTRHDEWDWHLHVTQPSAPLADRIGAEVAMGLLDLIRMDDLARLRQCAADDCDAVLVDLSRNRSRRYCDTGNCGNRMNAAAYRARKARSEA